MKKQKVYRNFCDSCSKYERVKILNIGGGSNIFLCSRCWKNEMNWRKSRNLEFSDSAKFDIIRWYDAEYPNFEETKNWVLQ